MYRITVWLPLKESQKVTPESVLLKQEDQFLRKRIGELGTDKAEWQVREARWEGERARLERIIERQTYALPKPTTERGVWGPVRPMAYLEVDRLHSQLW